MIIRIIKPYNTKGLDADANIFKNIIQKVYPHYTIIIDTQEAKLHSVDDVHIYISNTSEHLLKWAKTKMFMINHELFMQKDKDKDVLKNIDIVLARNNVGFKWASDIKEKYGLRYKVKLIKFTSNIPIVDIEKNWNMILHTAGEHHWKQTDAIIKAWIEHDDLPTIIITCTDQCYRNIQKLIPSKLPKNIVLYDSLIPKDDFIKIKNRIGIHLCPSIVEGFGHYINEARKVKSLVITSNLPPMNELIDNSSGVLIDCKDIGKKKNGADLCFISSDDIYKAVVRTINIDIDVRIKMVESAYNNFLDDYTYFEKAITELFL
jgi:hypothetical protein